jgi:dienelactone hydrolase
MSDLQHSTATHASYDPFSRGPAPVGVKTIELRDAEGRPLVTEVWYPATAKQRGKDIADATRDEFTIAPRMPRARQNAVRDAAPARGRRPLVLYCHGGYGHRRESSNLCTHLASHGYAVAAADYPGDHIADTMPASLGGNEKIATTPVDESCKNRARQTVATLDGLLAAAPTLGLAIDGARIGSTGISMGGFTSLGVSSLDRRFVASFAMCPMYGTRSPLKQVARLQSLLSVDDWPQRPDVFVLASELDSHVMLADLRDLHARLPTPKRFAVLKRAGHLHFADGAEAGHELYRKAYLSGAFPDPEIDAIALGTAMRPFAELVSEADASATARSLLLAHMDSVLRRSRTAASFLDRGLAATFAARGIDLEAA